MCNLKEKSSDGGIGLEYNWNIKYFYIDILNVFKKNYGWEIWLNDYCWYDIFK